MTRSTNARGSILVFLPMFILVGFASAGDPAQTEKTSNLPSCPVMGEPVDFSLQTDTEDGPVYFCCKRCIKKYQEKPAEFAKEVAGQRDALKDLPRTQISCPVTGKPISPKAFVDVGGRKIFGCGRKCVVKIAADMDKYEGKTESFTYQTKCPVMGVDIDPAVSLAVDGGSRVYFCCKKCVKAFEDNPAKYTPNLDAQGYGALARTIVQQTK